MVFEGNKTMIDPSKMEEMEEITLVPSSVKNTTPEDRLSPNWYEEEEEYLPFDDQQSENS